MLHCSPGRYRFAVLNPHTAFRHGRTIVIAKIKRQPFGKFEWSETWILSLVVNQRGLRSEEGVRRRFVPRKSKEEQMDFELRIWVLGEGLSC
jgi:hypothetical protein